MIDKIRLTFHSLTPIREQQQNMLFKNFTILPPPPLPLIGTHNVLFSNFWHFNCVENLPRATERISGSTSRLTDFFALSQPPSQLSF